VANYGLGRVFSVAKTIYAPTRQRALMNELLHGIGGGMAKAGMVEALYFGGFVGIILIWFGYRASLKKEPIFQM